MSFVGLGGIIDNVGKLNTPESLGISGTSAISLTIPSTGKGLVFQNVGDNIVWWGGDDVDAVSKRGNKMTPFASYQFRGATVAFEVYFICETGEATTIGYNTW